jgi:hypothetical protein
MVRYANLRSTGEPEYLNEALKNEKCEKAMDEEYLTRMQNRT